MDRRRWWFPSRLCASRPATRQPTGAAVAVVLDPVYKLLGDRDENANGDVGNLMNEFEQLASRTDAAVVLAHHFAKGDSTVKEAIDRISGVGAWGRDPIPSWS